MNLTVFSQLSSFTQPFFDAETCLRLTQTLAHFAWQGVVIAAVFAVIDLALRRQSANARYLAAVVTLAVLPICPLVTYCLTTPILDVREPGSPILPSSIAQRASQ